MTATQAAGYMIQRYDLEDAASVLENEGLVLLPTDALWSVACVADDPIALERIKRIIPPNKDQPYEVLFNSLEMLKKYTPRLHPRLETLLIYHTRPLSIVTDISQQLKHPLLEQNGKMAARVVQDNYCRSLIRILDKPLVVTSAHFPHSPYPSHFGRVRSDIIEGVDYVSKYRIKYSRLNKNSDQPTALVRLNGQKELEFLRE